MMGDEGDEAFAVVVVVVVSDVSFWGDNDTTLSDSSEGLVVTFVSLESAAILSHSGCSGLYLSPFL
jgi:hypothetical protein